MRKLLLWLALLAALTPSAGAQQADPTLAPGNPFIVHLHLIHPCSVTIQHEGKDTVWHHAPTSALDINIEADGEYRFTGQGVRDFWGVWQLADSTRWVRAGDSTTLDTVWVPNKAHIALVVVPIGALLVSFALAWIRRTRQREHVAQSQVEKYNSDTIATGLFPADGSLPQIIPPYRVLSVLGSGGMAVVYKVENDHGEQFALKLPFPNLLQDKKYMQRFAQEAKLGVRLRHPNLVSLLEVNDDSNPACPYPYLVMELVDGRTLDHILQEQHTLPEATALALIADVLAGLRVVHARGVVHRDIKPSNVMVTSAGRARLMDFGVAHKEQTTGEKLTGSDEILGTVRYMAPEQVMSRPLDGRCDIYTVGVMLYEMLNGTIPYGTDDTYAILGLKCTIALPPLSSQCQVRPQVGDLVDRMVALDPDDRPADVDAVQAALAAL